MVIRDYSAFELLGVERLLNSQVVVTQAFNPSIWEVEAGEPL